MPELPEVETVRRGLERTIVGKTVESVDVRVSKIFADDRTVIDRYLVGSQVTAVKRRAKVLLVELSNGLPRAKSRGWTLAVHLKMTGQLVVCRKSPSTGSGHSPEASGFTGGHPEKAYGSPLPHKHTYVVIQFTDGTNLYYNDLRKFGWFRLMPTKDVEPFLGAMNHGPEPLGEAFRLDGFQVALKRRRIPIKTALLDQTIVAGIGNIYADEALFAAKINPKRKASALKPAEISRLHAAIKHVLELGIEHGGTTLNTYVNVEGTSGKMREHLKVYGRESLPCTVCGTLIERLKIGQRSSHFCPRCQR